jgi:GAF domain-containing protein
MCADPEFGQPGAMESSNHDLAVRMAELARTVALPRTLEDILQEVTTAAVELIPNVSTAGILLVTKGGYESHAATDEIPHQLDDLQHTLQEGPCMDAAVDDAVVRIDDFRSEKRWPAYSAAVVKIGILSGLSFKLYTANQTAGALNLFGIEPTVWDTDAQVTGAVLAAHAAAAIMAGRHSEQMHSALATRDRIGQAKGIIMERFSIDDVQGFALLRRLSQESNTRLVEIAQRVIDSRGDNHAH